MYMKNAAYAREHGELDKYRASYWALKGCMESIEHIIAQEFDGMHLNREALIFALDLNDREYIGWVLACTLRYKSWDGRFSKRNREWATSISLPEIVQERMDEFVLSTHPAVLDGFVDMFRK